MENTNEENVVLKRMNENDKELFVKLRMDFFLEYYHLEETEKRQIEQSLRRYFDDHINKGDFIGLFAEYNGNIASSVYLAIVDKPPNPHFMDGKTGTLLNVFTYPAYRKKGLAQKLVTEIVNEAKEKGVKYFDLMATDAGYPLYKKLGFTESKDKNMCLKI